MTPAAMKTPLRRPSKNGHAQLGDKVFTTGQVAQLCMVAARTVAKWIDSGRLRGYRIPGNHHDRRVTRSALVEFLQRHGLTDALAALDAGTTVLLVAVDPVTAHGLATHLAGWKILAAADLFTAGFLVAERRPAVVVLDVGAVGRPEARRAGRALAERGVRVVGLVPDDERFLKWAEYGFSAALAASVDPAVVAGEVEGG